MHQRVSQLRVGHFVQALKQVSIPVSTFKDLESRVAKLEASGL